MTDSALARAADDAALDALTVSVETLAAIPSRTICLQLSFSKFGTRRTLDVNRLDISTTPTLPGKKRPKKGDDAPAAEAKPTDKTLLAASKRILESTELRAVGEVMGRAKAYIEVRAVPNSIVADGTYLVPIARVDEIEAELEGPMRTQFDAAVDKFVAAYPRLHDEIKVRLGDLYDEKDYPQGDRAVRAKFGMKKRWLALGVPDQLQTVSATLWEQEKQRAEAMWRDGADEITAALLGGFGDLVEHMVDRLGYDEDEEGNAKKRVFRDSTITRVETFLDTFKDRNITDNAQLNVLIDQAREVMSSVEDPAVMLRTSDRIRDRVRASFESIKAEVDQMRVIVKTRGIRFE